MATSSRMRYLFSPTLEVEDSYTEVVIGETSYQARLIGADSTSGLVLMKIDASGLPWLPLAETGALELGADVRGFGRAPVWAPDESPELTRGAISSVKVTNGQDIQIDADIKPSHCGGPFVNQRGEVVAAIGWGQNQSAISTRVIRSLLDEAQVTLPAATVPADDLSGVELARQVTPAVAYVRTTVRRATLQTHSGVTRVVGLAGHEQLITQGAADDPTVKLWSLRTGQLLDAAGSAEQPVVDAAFSSRTGRLAVSFKNGAVVILSTTENKILGSWAAFVRGEINDDGYEPEPEDVNVEISADGSTVAASWDDRFRVWDINGQLLDDITLPDLHWWYAPSDDSFWESPWALSGDGKQAAFIADPDNTPDTDFIRVYDREQRQIVKSMQVDYAARLAFAADGQRLFIDGLRRIWDLRSQSVIEPEVWPDAEIFPDGADQVLMAGSDVAGENLVRVRIDVWQRDRLIHRARVQSRPLPAQENWDYKPKSMCASADGLLAATADDTEQSRGLVRLWYLDDLKEQTVAHVVLDAHERRLQGLTDSAMLFSPQGDLVANWTQHYGDNSSPSTLFLSDARTGIARQTIALATPRPHLVTFSGDGQRITTAERQGTENDETFEITVWSAATGEIIRKVPFAGFSYVSPYLSEHGEWLMAAGFSGGETNESGTPTPSRRGYQIWDVETGEAWSPLKDESGADVVLTGVSFSPDGRMFVAGDTSEHLRIWDTTTRALRATLDLRSRGAPGVHAYSGDGQLIAGCVPGGLLLWDGKTGELVHEFADPSPADPAAHFYPVVFSPADDIVAAADPQGNILAWDVRSGQLLQKLQNPLPLNERGQASIGRPTFSPAGEQLVAWYWQPEGPQFVVWNVADGSVVEVFSPAPGWPQQMMVSADGERLIVGCNDGVLRIHEIGAESRRSAVVDGYLARAQQRISTKQPDLAEADFSRVLELAPWRASTYLARADVRLQQEKSEDAESDLVAAVDLDPQNVDIYSKLASLRLDSGQYAEALADYDVAIALGRGDPYTHIARGKCHEALEHWPAAIDDYTAAIQGFPLLIVEAVLHRGLCYVKTGQWREALADLQKVQGMAPAELQEQYAAALELATTEAGKLPPLVTTPAEPSPQVTATPTPSQPEVAPEPRAAQIPTINTPPGVDELVVVLRDVRMQAKNLSPSILPKGTVFGVGEVHGSYLLPDTDFQLPQFALHEGITLGWVPRDAVDHAVNVFAALTRRIESNPRDAEALRERAQLAFTMMDLLPLEHLQRLTSDPVLKSYFLPEDERTDASVVADLYGCIAVRPDDAGARELLAFILRSHFVWSAEANREKYSDWQSEYDAALRLSRSAGDTEAVARILLRRPLAFVAKEDYASALRDINEYIRLKPNSGGGYYVRSIIYDERQMSSQAERDLAQAFRLYPKVEDDPGLVDEVDWYVMLDIMADEGG